MKNLFTLLLFIAFAGIYNSQAKEVVFVEPIEISEAQNQYAATAYTRKGYSESSINITIHGSDNSPYGFSITKVVCRGNTVSHSAVYGEKNTYKFSYGGETFYFSV